ncbi:MAG: sigma-70 family RNA polymerase sigma factor [Ruminococcaceae bacterium]|nr:sigma-70 family RNA polymerase sigma factor [Oscillospiraceae bacterium]
MEDQAIIELYFARSEDAVGETDRKYGAFCRRVACNILSVREDAEECVNDTYHAAWNAIPPERPASLRAYLGAITRNLSVARWRTEHAQKRFAGMETLLSELDECVPAREGTEADFARGELTEAIAAWLRGLAPDDRALFVRRYWYGDAVKALAKECGVGENQMAQRMRRLRRGLRAALEEGGFSV